MKMKNITDNMLVGMSCDKIGCINYADSGSVYCTEHMPKIPRDLPTKLASRKLKLDAERLR